MGGGARTLYDKVWDRHVVRRHEDGTDLLYVDRHLVQEVSSPQAFAGLEARGLGLRRPDAHLSVADHAVPTTDRDRPLRDGLAARQVERLRRNARRVDDPVRRARMERSLAYMGLDPGTALRDVRIDRVFIGSCTNGRIEDLRRAAGVLRGRRVAPGVRAIVVPGSAGTRSEAEAEGLDRVFREAGFEWRASGCSMCVGMNEDRLSEGERCASTSNRNFEGRQGRGGRTHLMSPEMAVAAALAESSIDTDIIFPARFLLLLDREGLGRHLFHERRHMRAPGSEPFVLDRPPYDRARILVAGPAFGTGSSREQAVWALADFGIRCVIAPSFGDIFFGNCFRNGVLPVVLPPADHARVLAEAEATCPPSASASPTAARSPSTSSPTASAR